MAGSAALFTLSGLDGLYEVDSYATDKAGNNETAHSTSAYLDNTPVATIAAPTATQYGHSDILTLIYSVSDGSGSGVQSSAPTMDGKTTLQDGTPVANNLVIYLLTQMSVDTHTFAVASLDNLNNAGTQSVTFSIVVTPDSIKGDVTQFLQGGAIKNSGEATSLLAKLDAAAAARARGECSTAANLYQAFINELMAQSGKGVDPAAATIMLSDAQYLITHCP